MIVSSNLYVQFLNDILYIRARARFRELDMYHRVQLDVSNVSSITNEETETGWIIMGNT